MTHASSSMAVAEEATIVVPPTTTNANFNLFVPTAPPLFTRIILSIAIQKSYCSSLVYCHFLPSHLDSVSPVAATALPVTIVSKSLVHDTPLIFQCPLRNLPFTYFLSNHTALYQYYHANPYHTQAANHQTFILPIRHQYFNTRGKIENC